MRAPKLSALLVNLEQFALTWAASKPRLMCQLYAVKDGTSLEDHVQQMAHLKGQLLVAGMVIDEPVFIEVFLCSVIAFYSDAFLALLATSDMTISKMFSALAHFRVLRKRNSKTTSTAQGFEEVSKWHTWRANTVLTVSTLRPADHE
ncbi:hypothetical protein V1508DRAFT_187896 [Lipomyces doorenjongii]|uniref:uncharacterized protein n=1 Tax=Lipomyces doorenjongii TaxID=383834 RepID=UPI0034CEF4B3